MYFLRLCYFLCFRLVILKYELRLRIWECAFSFFFYEECNYFSVFILCLHTVDYQHSETTVTALMIAAGRGFLEIVEQLLTLGADPCLKSSNDWSALDWARKFEQDDIVALLEAQLYVF